jgi:hypothetical protein
MTAPFDFTPEQWQEVEARLQTAKPASAPTPSNSIQHERLLLVKQLLAREYEALNLYEPLPMAEQFHKCNSLWRLADGGNRASKTLTCCVEDARALTGQDPYRKYPTKNGRAIFVGLKLTHIALLYRALFEPGAFKLIKDEHTKLYRSVRYDRNDPRSLQPYDLAFREKWIDAPPLIPKRFYYKPAWEDVRQRIPKTIRFKNGWHTLWLSALGDPEQGEHYNLVHFDEEMPNPEFYTEAHRGLTRLHETIAQRPKGIWSATSQVANIELAELRAKAKQDPDSDFVQHFVFLIEDNPYFLSEARQEFQDGLSEEDKLTRYHGIPASEVRRIYPTFKPEGDSALGTGHGCDAFEIDPAIFTRYIITDPSVRHCATLLVAIDPATQYLTVYDAFDINQATARLWAEEIRKRQNGFLFEAAVLDKQMGSQSTMGRENTTVAREYWEALKEAGVEVRRKGDLQGFIPSCNDVEARTHALIKTLEVRGYGEHLGTSRLRIMRGLTPELRKQVQRQQTDPRNPKKRLHDKRFPYDFCDDLEYAAAADLPYHTPVAIVDPETPTTHTAYEIFQIRRSLRQKHDRAKVRAACGSPFVALH